ncbi:MAG: ACP S-malonyltransferase [Oxalobacter sp.]|nr:ACP S-malonyltransferase [Oxalobacter sp.]
MAKFAFVFPGQGSQAVGMLNGFAGNAAVQETVAEASEALGFDIGKMIAEGPKESLDLTVNTQPVMLTTSIAFYRAWLAAGGAAPEVVAGHSLGEFSALVASGVIPLADAVKLVRFRATAMQEAVPVGVGGMAAIIGLDAEALKAVCAEAAEGDVVEPANFNSPTQTVIAGHKTALDRACKLAKAKGAKRALPLPVSAPFHSSLLVPASARLADYMKDMVFSAPKIPVINNVDVAIQDDPAAIKDALVRQVASSVRWVETVQKMASMGITHIVDCGPGKVLAGMVKRIDGSVSGLAIVDQASLDAALEALK